MPHDPHRPPAGLQRLRLGLSNLGDLLRQGRLTEPYRADFVVEHEGPNHHLRHYPPRATPTEGDPILFVPPLMVTAEIYDVSAELSAVTWLLDQGLDVWLVDFGAPEHEREGLARTLDDHILAVNDAVDEVHHRTGRDVHLIGYSQGGLFVYQVAAFRRCRNLRSLVTMGSPVDMRRNLPVPLYEDVAERILRDAWRAVSRPMSTVEGLPGTLTSWGFKVLSLRKEAEQLVEFVANLHDREALERHEAKRSFLGGDGFVWWPGPAFRTFVDQVLVENRLTSGGFVVDGRVVSMEDVTVPVLAFLGERDDFAHAEAVRAIHRVAPNAQVHEVTLDTGHFGLVVGSRALEVTWPTVARWVRSGAREAPPEPDPDTAGSGPAWRRVAPIWPAWQRAGRMARELSALWEVVRFDRPRRERLRRGRSRLAFGAGWALARSAREAPDDPFVLFGSRAVSLQEAQRRVDRLASLLLDAGVAAGQTVRLDLDETPDYLTALCAVSRLGATLEPGPLAGAVGVDVRLADAAHLAGEPVSAPLTVCLGPPAAAGTPRDSESTVVIPLTALDATDDQTGRTSDELGRADPEAIALWLSDPRDPSAPLAIRNHGWSAAALHTAVACRLRPGDTLYCALPLHSPLALLCALPPSLIARTRLAVGPMTPPTLVDQLRRIGATVAFLTHAQAQAWAIAEPQDRERRHRVRCVVLDTHDGDLARRLADRYGVPRILGGRIDASQRRPSPLQLENLLD